MHLVWSEDIKTCIYYSLCYSPNLKLSIGPFHHKIQFDNCEGDDVSPALEEIMEDGVLSPQNIHEITVKTACYVHIC